MIKRIKNKLSGGKGALLGFRFFLALLIVFTLQTQVLTQPVFARGAGSGKIGEFKTEDFLGNVGIGLGSSFVGSAISEGLNSSFNGVDFFSGGQVANSTTGITTTYGGFNGAISSWNNVSTWTSSLNSMAALSQLSSGVNMLGQQQEWENSQAAFTSAVVQGAVGGVLSPTSTLGVPSTHNIPTCAKAATIGAIGGTAEGAILANNIDGNGKIKPWVSATAGLAGTFTEAAVNSLVTPVVPKFEEETTIDFHDYYSDETKYVYDSEIGDWKYTGHLPETITKPDRSRVNIVSVPGSGNPNAVITTTTYKRFSTASNLGEALTYGEVQAISAIPSRAISAGVSTITKDMDRDDAFRTRQAFRGVYPIAGVVYKNEIRDPVFEQFNDLEPYIGSDGTAGKDVLHIDQGTYQQAPQIEATPVPITPIIRNIDIE